jgi:hypothetical protein
MCLCGYASSDEYPHQYPVFAGGLQEIKKAALSSVEGWIGEKKKFTQRHFSLTKFIRDVGETK